jgi:hypothetical protein
MDKAIKVTKPTEPLLFKRRREFTPNEMFAMLNAYNKADGSYRSVARDCNVSQPTLKDLISGKGRPELDAEYPGFAEERQKAQAKAAGWSLRLRKNLGFRTSDPTKTRFETDWDSFKSVAALKSIVDSRYKQLAEAGVNNAR